MPEEYFLQNPSQQKFYKVVAFWMGLIGLNTQYWHWFALPGNILYRMQRMIVILFAPVTIISEVLYLYLHYEDHEFAERSIMFTVLPFGFMTILKLFIAQLPSYKRVLKYFMDKIHLHLCLKGDYNNEKLIFVKEVLINAEKSSRYALKMIMTLVIICFFSWMIFPVVHNVQNNPQLLSNNITKRLEILVYMWLPFDYELSFYGYLVVQVVGGYCGFVGVVLIAFFDWINLAIIFHLLGHINIIKYDLRTAFVRGMTKDDVRMKLKNIMDHYYFVTKTFKDVEAVFGLNVAGIYAQNLVQGGLLLYQLSSADLSTEAVLTVGLMAPIVVGLMTIMSLVLENIRIQAEEIPNLVYDLPWESMSVENQKYVLGLLVQVKPTLEFKAAFNIKTGVQPAIQIVKTAFSYYVMIKARV